MGGVTPKKGKPAAEDKGPSESHLPLCSTPTHPAEYSIRLRTAGLVFCKPGKEPTPHQSFLHLSWVHGNKLRKGRPETQGKAHYPNTVEALEREHRSKEKDGPTRHWEGSLASDTEVRPHIPQELSHWPRQLSYPQRLQLSSCILPAPFIGHQKVLSPGAVSLALF